MTEARDYSATLFLPQTDFPMRAGLPQKEPEILARWAKLDLYQRLREDAKGRTKFVLHDGPPYANGNIHIGTALNKILKDVVTRSQQMLGYDSNYVPGWDCHGLPIEWKIEEENYRSKNKAKPDLKNSAAMIAFRAGVPRLCDALARRAARGVQAARRRGRLGQSLHHDELSGRSADRARTDEVRREWHVYRGSKPVMWSVVEKTALAEAEVEYEDYTSDTVWVKFPVAYRDGRPQSGGSGTLMPEMHKLLPLNASVVIWTTTPWTIPGNRAISYSPKIAYALYDVTDAPPTIGRRLATVTFSRTSLPPKSSSRRASANIGSCDEVCDGRSRAA